MPSDAQQTTPVGWLAAAREAYKAAAGTYKLTDKGWVRVA